MKCFSCEINIPLEMKAALISNCCPFCGNQILDETYSIIRKNLIQDLSTYNLNDDTLEGILNIVLYKYIYKILEFDETSDEVSVDAVNIPKTSNGLPSNIQEHIKNVKALHTISSRDEEFNKEDLDALELLNDGRIDEFFDQDNGEDSIDLSDDEHIAPSSINAPAAMIPKQPLKTNGSCDVGIIRRA